MSDEANDILLERAGEMIDFWEGTITAKILQMDVDNHDLEALAEHLSIAEGMVDKA